MQQALKTSKCRPGVQRYKYSSKLSNRARDTRMYLINSAVFSIVQMKTMLPFNRVSLTSVFLQSILTEISKGRRRVFWSFVCYFRISHI